MSSATSKDEEPSIAVIILYQLCFCYKCDDKFMAKNSKTWPDPVLNWPELPTFPPKGIWWVVLWMCNNLCTLQIHFTDLLVISFIVFIVMNAQMRLRMNKARRVGSLQESLDARKVKSLCYIW